MEYSDSTFDPITPCPYSHDFTLLYIKLHLPVTCPLYLHFIFSKLLAPLVVSTCVVFKISTFGCVHVTWIHCRSLDCGRFYIVVILRSRGQQQQQPTYVFRPEVVLVNFCM